jgi:hypothetical protein
MATVSLFTYFYDMGTYAGPDGLTPGETTGFWWGPADVFRDGAVTVTPHPSTVVAGGSGSAVATQEAKASDISITTQLVPGPFPGSDVLVNANFTNVGSAAIRYLNVSIGVISS